MLSTTPRPWPISDGASMLVMLPRRFGTSCELWAVYCCSA